LGTSDYFRRTFIVLNYYRYTPLSWISRKVRLVSIPIYDAQSGHYISADHQRVAELINDYDYSLFLVWIPPSDRTGEIYPFGILHRPIGRPEYIVRRLKESEVNADLIAWLWTNDNERNNPIAVLEKQEQAEKALKLKKHLDELQEQKDIALSVINSPLNTYRHAGKVYK
jgi:hypothetical protein